MDGKIWNKIIWILKREEFLGNDKINFSKVRENLKKCSRIDITNSKKKDREDFKTMEDIRKAIINCKKCPLYLSRTNPVVGEGPLTPNILFIGEAPGADEDISGRPFVGRSGRKLREILNSIGITDDMFYITNILKCRPPNNRDPNSKEIDACVPYLDFQIKKLNPDVICTLGTFASQFILKTNERIGILRGKVHHKNNRTIIATYHPSFILRNQSMGSVLKNDLLLCLNEVKKL
jgi:DNA polymerase